MGCLSGHKVQGERKLADLKKIMFYYGNVLLAFIVTRTT